MKRVLLTSLITAVLLSGCSVFNKLFMKVINHPMPELVVEVLPVMDPALDEDLTAVCSTVKAPNQLWGGLDPAYPMAECAVPANDDSVFVDLPNLYKSGCTLPVYHSLLIYQDGEYKNINHLSVLQETFAPIESPDEALSYALLATGTYALYAQKVDWNQDYFQRVLEDTHVEQISDGWLINLFKYQLCGCNDHYEYSIEVLVTFDGNVTAGEYVPLDGDPLQRGMCVD